MAQEKKWIQSAIKRPGALRAKAERAGMSTHAYAQAHQDDPGRTGRQARLALILMRIRRRRLARGGRRRA